MNTGDYEIPFDAKGNQQHYGENWGIDGRCGSKWKQNFDFNDVLTYEGFERGRSAAYFIFRRTDGTQVTMFLKEFDSCVKHFNAGKVTGRFRFIKRGQNYGVARVGEYHV